MTNIPQNVLLKAINIGAGTTGTRDLTRLICKEFGVISLHHTAVCNTNFHGITEQYAPLAWYFDTKASDFLLFYKDVLKEALQQYEFITDDPFAQMFPDVLLAAPHISVIATLRDPLMWARKRKEKHPSAAICHESLWSHPGVFHPFDFVGCLQAVGDKTVGDAILTIRNVTEVSLANAFVQYNTVSFHQVLAAGCPLQVFCFWDLSREQHSAPRLKKTLRTFWNSSDLTSNFLSRKYNGNQAKLRTNRNLVKWHVISSYYPSPALPSTVVESSWDFVWMWLVFLTLVVMAFKHTRYC